MTVALQVFNKFDTDKSGQISIGELSGVLRDIGLVLPPVPRIDIIVPVFLIWHCNAE